jgi:hypothetical protein
MALGELTRQLVDADVNVDLAYTTFGGMKVVIATDDLESARAALQYRSAHAREQVSSRWSTIFQDQPR